MTRGCMFRPPVIFTTNSSRVLALALLLSVILPVLLQGCMVTKEHTELGPFYYKRPLPRGNGTESAILWPFFQWTHTEKAKEFAVRPIFNYRFANTEGIKGKVREIQAIWPLFLYRESEALAYSRTRVYPFFYRTRYRHADGEKEIDTFLLPWRY